MSTLSSNLKQMKAKITAGSIKLGNGAQFWAYISPQNNTEEVLKKWKVVIEQEDGNWIGEINSDNPQKTLQTPHLSGVFKVTVTAAGKKFPPKRLTPLSDSQPDIGCNSNCMAMVGIVANETGTDANYWTVWDAVCNH